ncbi:uncharacterized protein LOC143022049 [Oratosquilla oratoria]|uniref:uncharacterized protein LOC143022049 n=1 Tax=Oratosquilla oratoria TaxID=337810 RepID=UPI003F7627CF
MLDIHRLRHDPLPLPLLLLLASTVTAMPSVSKGRVCVIEQRPTTCLNLMMETGNSLECVTARDRMDCLKLIETGQADVGLFEAEDLALASDIFRDKYSVLLNVDRQDDAGSYGAVLLAKPENTHGGEITSMCHPGFNFDHFYPSSLTRISSIKGSQHNILPEIQAMIKRASDEYTSACVPGIWSHDPTLDKQLKFKHSHLCKACAQGECSNTDYAGAAGSIKCFLNDAANATWTTDKEARTMAGKYPEVDFEYVCQDLTREPRSSKNPCTWGRRPKAVILGPLCEGQDCSQQSSIVNNVLQRMEIVTTVLGLAQGTKLTRPDSNDMTPSKVLAQAGLHTSLVESETSEVKLCVRGEEEKAKCLQLKWAGLAYGVDTGVTCTEADSTSKCVKMIYQRAADAIALDGGEVHEAMRDYDFERILSEVYLSGKEKETSSYYAVAVVRKSSEIRSFKDLNGTKSCHTGIGKTSGWKMPVTELIRQRLIDPKKCDFVTSMAEFFSGGSCLPGAKLKKYNPNFSYVDRLCKHCKSNCNRGSDEPYYSYTGAFRCLVEGGGDVAFVKHTTVPDNTDLNNMQEWARNLKKDDFELLCPTGHRNSIDNYKHCNLNIVPAHEVLVRRSLADSRKATIRHVLLTLGAIFKEKATPSKTFKLFGKFNNIPDLIFKDSAKGLKSLADDTPVESKAKLDYFRKLDDLYSCEVRVCALSGYEDDCEEMAKEMHDYGQRCVSARDRLDCVKKVNHGEADITPIPGGYLSVYKSLRIIGYMKDPHSYNEKFRYEAVAVVRKSTVKNLQDLKGKRSCLASYSRTIGWRVLKAKLKHMGILETPCTEGKSSLEHEMEALSSTFSKSCLPGTWATTEDMDIELKTKYPSLCSMCKSGTCDRNDEYVGYSGALRCLTENNGDVAFSILSDTKNFFEENKINANDYGLLCPDGSIIDITGATTTEDCFWAARPWDVYVANGHISDMKMGILTDFVKRAKFEGEVKSAKWFETVLGMSYQSRDFYNAEKNKAIAEYNAESGMDIVAEERVCDKDPVRLCVHSEEEREKCRDLAFALGTYGVNPSLVCVQAEDTSSCIEHVANGQADIIAIDGTDFYNAYKNHNLQSILTEAYGEHKNRYYAVAVVKNESDVTTLEGLKGKKSCHTGIEKTAGWRMPIATLREQGLISKRSCDFPTEIGKFFNASCAPGAKLPKYDPFKTNPESLCELCVGEAYKVAVTGLVRVVPRKGDQLYKCDRSSKELFYSYTGAFRCLVEGGGDVAFVKHSTVLDNTDGNNKDPWASKLKSGSFRLLCPEGGTFKPQDYRQCHLAQVPAHVVVTRRAETDSRKEDMRHVLLKANEYFGAKDSFFVLFGKYFERSDLLFKDSTTSLELTKDDNYNKYFGKLHELQQCVNTG